MMIPEENDFVKHVLKIFGGETLRYTRYGLRRADPVCTRCGGEIAEGERSWVINGERLCEICLGEFAREVFSPFCTLRGEERP